MDTISLMFKNDAVFKSMIGMTYHNKLTLMLYDLCKFCDKQGFHDPVITSGWRSKRIHPNDSGIHCTIPCRAFDIRSRIYSTNEISAIVDYLCEWWIYDVDRPHMKPCIYHNTGQGWHFHCQVHNNTIRRAAEYE